MWNLCVDDSLSLYRSIIIILVFNWTMVRICTFYFHLKNVYRDTSRKGIQGNKNLEEKTNCMGRPSRAWALINAKPLRWYNIISFVTMIELFIYCDQFLYVPICTFLFHFKNVQHQTLRMISGNVNVSRCTDGHAPWHSLATL